jgi:hypothetical protein
MALILTILCVYRYSLIYHTFDHLTHVHIMVLSDSAFEYFLLTQSKVRAALAQARSGSAFVYEDEEFFVRYETLRSSWIAHESQRETCHRAAIGRSTLKEWEDLFVTHGAIGLLPDIALVACDPILEQLSLLIKETRQHEQANYTLRLAEALKLPGVTLDLVRRIQRSHGFGQRQDNNDRQFYQRLQLIFDSFDHKKKRVKGRSGHDRKRRAATFIAFDCDTFQQRVELFRTLALSDSSRAIRPALMQFGIHPNRYYEIKERYMTYGIWGLVDLIHTPRVGEKISPELELKIIEERLVDPKLSAQKMMDKLQLKCCRARVLAVYKRWRLSQFSVPVTLHGVIAVPPQTEANTIPVAQSAKSRFPTLLSVANLKINSGFQQILTYLTNRRVPVSNPGALIIAPFLNQFGIVESLHTYGPACLRTTEITNDIIVNVLRIIAGFPTIHDFTRNSDRSVALGAGLSLIPRKSRFYESFDDLRFHHLQNLRNDAAVRAKELGVIEGKEIAIDYHSDPTDTRFPHDKSFSKAPDKNGDMVYAHRPQILWDSAANSVINIAYCEGRSRAPSALYKFMEENLYKIIDPIAIKEIYTDSEYTGEKQLVYLVVRSKSFVTMCLKQNPRIKQWKEQVINKGQWSPYGKGYRIATSEFILSQTEIPIRFVVKQNVETNETRCFGSTHTDMSPQKILDAYHLRWPIETGIRDLIENYFLNNPTGTSAEKTETHYYCVMLARQCFDYFLSVFSQPQWKTPQDWQWVIGTIRTTLFTNQNCELTINESGDLELTYLDGDPTGIKTHLKRVMEDRKKMNLNTVAWWGGKGIAIKIEDRFNFKSGPEIT